jgi:protein SCO1/2
MPSAVLTDSHGRPFDLRARTDGYVTLVLFGYTNCPDVCPVHLANLTAALRQAGNIPRNQLRVLFITTDPARDTPARLRQWMSHFDPTFIGLTGPKAVLDSLQREMQLPVAVKEASNSAGDYAVGHAAQVLVFTRDDRAHLAYPFGTKQQDWVDDLPRLLKETWGASGGSAAQQS